MTTRNYEGMFILDSNPAAEDFEATAGKVDEILQKHGATLVQKEKWDDRKLAYEIKGHRRGTYYLVYFEVDSSAIQFINEDIRLTETVLRHLVLVLDEPIEVHTARQAAERERMAEESRKSALGGWGGGGRRSGPRSGDRRDRGGSRDDDEDNVVDALSALADDGSAS